MLDALQLEGLPQVPAFFDPEFMQLLPGSPMLPLEPPLPLPLELKQQTLLLPPLHRPYSMLDALQLEGLPQVPAFFDPEFMQLLPGSPMLPPPKPDPDPDPDPDPERQHFTLADPGHFPLTADPEQCCSSLQRPPADWHLNCTSVKPD